MLETVCTNLPSRPHVERGAHRKQWVLTYDWLLKLKLDLQAQGSRFAKDGGYVKWIKKGTEKVFQAQRR